jgi:hypothetical protein
MPALARGRMSSNASTVVIDKRAAPQPPLKMPERTRMLAPNPIVHDSASLLGDVRMLLSSWPGLIDYPERLAAFCGVDEHAVQAVLEALEVEGELLS